MVADIYNNIPPAALVGPAVKGFAITPSDITDLTNTTRYIYVGGAGAVAIMFRDGTTVTLAAVPVGTLLPVRAMRVLATGTTATNLIGLY